MTPQMWMIVGLGIVLAAVLGFFLGRRSAPTQKRLEAMEEERDSAHAEAERVQGEVARHFEQSARMFGRLADDYRTFFEHFAETAQNLGLSEGRARELLHRADPRLVADQAGTSAAGGAADAPAAGDSESPKTEPTAATGDPDSRSSANEEKPRSEPGPKSETKTGRGESGTDHGPASSRPTANDSDAAATASDEGKETEEPDARESAGVRTAGGGRGQDG